MDAPIDIADTDNVDDTNVEPLKANSRSTGTMDADIATPVESPSANPRCKGIQDSVPLLMRYAECSALIAMDRTTPILIYLSAWSEYGEVDLTITGDTVRIDPSTHDGGNKILSRDTLDISTFDNVSEIVKSCVLNTNEDIDDETDAQLIRWSIKVRKTAGEENDATWGELEGCVAGFDPFGTILEFALSDLRAHDTFVPIQKPGLLAHNVIHKSMRLLSEEPLCEFPITSKKAWVGIRS